MNWRFDTLLLLSALVLLAIPAWGARTYQIVDTGQQNFYNNHNEINQPEVGQPFYGQDAQYQGVEPKYRNNGDGTVSDLNTGLMWVQARGKKMTWDEARAGAARCRVGGYTDWRMPTIKELYSLIDFSGRSPGPGESSKPYINTRYFDFTYGDSSKGERLIDCQDWSSTPYIKTTMNGNPTIFGVNFADGRIKGYPKTVRRREGERINSLYVRYVRGNPLYGKNDFHDNGDGTVTDRATGLMWTKADSGRGMNWQQALAYASNCKVAGYGDWRLPNAKELQSIVDYSRVPAIDPIFEISRLSSGEYPYFWTSTTHMDGPPGRLGSAAVYIAFGRALGWMQFPPGSGNYRLLDVHGAGAQRSDPKSGDPSLFPHGRGPQGDVIRIYNFVRCVRSVGAAPRSAAFTQVADKTTAMATPARPVHDFNASSSERRPERELRQRAGFQPHGDFSVIILGSGSPQYNAERSGPSAMIQYHGHYILVDMGNGTQARLHEAHISWPKIDALFITHHHLDHTEELIPIFIHTHLTGRTVPVIGPPRTKEYVNFITKFYAQDIKYRLQRRGRTMADFGAAPVREVTGGETFELDGMKVTVAKMKHTIFTVGYRFDADGKSIVISGDTTYTDNLIRLARGADVLVMDSGGAPVRQMRGASGHRGPNDFGRNRALSEANGRDALHAHASREEVCEMASRAGVKELVLTHIGPGKVDVQATKEAIGKLYHGEVVVGRDLMEVVPGQAEPTSLSTDATMSQGQQSRFIRRFDQNGDGNVSRDEPSPRSADATMSQRRQSRFIRRFDRNGDGKVSREEFPGSTARFDRLDTNHDGYISEDEAPQGPPRGPRRRGQGPIRQSSSRYDDLN